MVVAADMGRSFGKSLKLVNLKGVGLSERSADALAMSLGKAAFKSSYSPLFILKIG